MGHENYFDNYFGIYIYNLLKNLARFRFTVKDKLFLAVTYIGVPSVPSSPLPEISGFGKNIKMLSYIKHWHGEQVQINTFKVKKLFISIRRFKMTGRILVGS